jgi:CrcB protein
MRDFPLYAAIAVCGSLGALIRYTVSTWASQWPGFPYGTLIVNVVGCFLLGALAYSPLTDLTFVTPQHRAAVGTGFLGALTTFSTFGVETFERIEKNQWHLAGLNITANILLGLLAVWLGRTLIQALLSP